jgi:Uma2 family endonuclease
MSAGASTSEASRSERYRFTAAEFLRMIDAGVFRDDERIELVRGDILEVTPQGPEHRGLKDDLHARLVAGYREQNVHVLDQGPLLAGARGVPEPDLAVIRGRARDYLKRHPDASEALLVIEIAKTSQERDRTKAADYASGGAPVYWLLDLEARTLDVYTDPDREHGRYRRIVSLGDDENVSLPEIDETWTVASLLA